MSIRQICCTVLACASVPALGNPHPWPRRTSSTRTMQDIALPEGYTRVSTQPKTFGHWLRQLPLSPAGTPVLLHNGQKKPNQNVHHAVIDLDTGRPDLQQCADAVMRLRAEYLWSQQNFDGICFRFTNGDPAAWTAWRQGIRPRVNKRKVSWEKRANPDPSYKNFKRYLQNVFMYAGTASLEKELLPVKDPNSIQIGDIFIQGGFPGHAIIVVDLAKRGDKRVLLLGQSYMPAQDFHVLKNPAQKNPWYSITLSLPLTTPEWTFSLSDLHRFQNAPCPKRRLN
jgi:hypothetical protein